MWFGIGRFGEAGQVGLDVTLGSFGVLSIRPELPHPFLKDTKKEEESNLLGFCVLFLILLSSFFRQKSQSESEDVF